MQWLLSPKYGIKIGLKFLPLLLGSSFPLFNSSLSLQGKVLLSFVHLIQIYILNETPPLLFFTGHKQHPPGTATEEPRHMNKMAANQCDKGKRKDVRIQGQ